MIEKAAAKVIHNGGVVIYPTETVYGIGASALLEDAILAVFELKKRDLDKPLSVAVSSFEMLASVADLDDEEWALARRLLPGPVTILVKPKTCLPKSLTASSSLVGVRFPDHPLALRLIDACGPITSTSANLSGHPPPTRVEEIDETLAKSVDMVIDDGQCRYGEPSTLVDLKARKILRSGTGLDRVLEILGIT